ncbi:hypothetical protein CR513_23241, partial [Mucuna pruriens]
MQKGKYRYMKLNLLLRDITRDKALIIRRLFSKFHQIYVKTTFLNGDLCEDVYMDQIDGLKEKKNAIDQCIYLKNRGRKFIIIVLYVDDILLAYNYMNFLFATKQMLTTLFYMKDLGRASFVLGIKIHHDRSCVVLGLS